MAGEQAADRSGAGEENRPDHAVSAVEGAAGPGPPRRRRGRRNSRPPVSPLGRTIRTSAIRTPSTITRVPEGRSSVNAPKIWTPFSASERNESSALIASAPTTAPQRLDDPPT